MINYFDLGLYKDALEMEQLANIISKYNISFNIPYKMYGFEANPDFANAAKQKFSSNPNISIHNLAICNEDKQVQLFLSGGKGDSIYESKFSKKTKKITVQGKKFSSFIKENNINLDNNINIVKINIEGAEWDFFNDIINSGIHKYISIYIGRGHDPHKIEEFIKNGTNIKYDQLLKDNNIKIQRYCGEYPFEKNFDIEGFIRKEIINKYIPNAKQ